MKRTGLKAKAEELGQSDGTDAASWYFDRTEPKRADFMRVLKGIQDGDPEIMDTLPSSPGDAAATPNELYETLGLTAEFIAMPEQTEFLSELLVAYENAFRTAAQHGVETYCRENLRRNIRFTLEVEAEEQDAPSLLIAIEEVLCKLNCSLNFSEFEDDDWEG